MTAPISNLEAQFASQQFNDRTMNRLTLEDDIDEIMHLDRLRKVAQQMRDEGLKGLEKAGPASCWEVHSTEGEISKEQKSWREQYWVRKDTGEFSDKIPAALVTSVCTKHFSRSVCQEDIQIDKEENPEPDKIRMRTKSRFQGIWSFAIDYLADYGNENETDTEDKRSDGLNFEVFEATRVLQAILRVSDLALSGSTVKAYEKIITEIRQRPVVGAARAGGVGSPSAFITAECLKAIRAVERRIDCTADFFETLLNFISDVRNRAKNNEVEEAELLLAHLDDWTFMDLRRLAMHYHTAFYNLSLSSFVDLSEQTLKYLSELSCLPYDKDANESELVNKAFSKLEEFLECLIEDIDSVLEGLGEVAKQVREWEESRAESEENNSDKNSVSYRVNAIYNVISLVFLKELNSERRSKESKELEVLEELREEDKAILREIQSGELRIEQLLHRTRYSPEKPWVILESNEEKKQPRKRLPKKVDKCEKCKKSKKGKKCANCKLVDKDDWERLKGVLNRVICQKLRNEAAEIRKHYLVVRQYLETVLDHEVGKPEGQIPVAGELAAAAAAYARLDRDPETDDVRLEKAALILENTIGPDGSFETATHVATALNGGISVVMQGSEVLRAYSQLLQRVSFDVKPATVEKILRYFKKNAVYDKVNRYRLIGWAADGGAPPLKAHRWVSALCILALDRVVRMLDERINRRVRRHFSSKDAFDFKKAKTPTLDKLIYPDYGMACFYQTLGRETNSAIADTEGESIAFFLERARAHITKSPMREGKYRQPCYSMLLYGPPGTGKTTFLEALACTAQRPMIEITPSDIIEEGESHVERRARNVFKALSALTRCVILFDEFDPVLKSRQFDGDKTPSVFSFVTPGMLPKLKDLNSHAEEQQVVFALNTNRVGSLDEAAIRSGRFDHKIGVFPPDALSRTGAINQAVMNAYRGICDNGQNDRFEGPGWIPARVIQLISDTKGIGMTLLSAKGNVRPYAPVPDLTKLDKNTVLNCALRTIKNGGGDNNRVSDDAARRLKAMLRFSVGPPDANPLLPRTGYGNVFYDESRRWAWILLSEERLSVAISEGILNLSQEEGEPFPTIKEHDQAEIEEKKESKVDKYVYENHIWVEFSKKLRDKCKEITDADINKKMRELGWNTKEDSALG